MEPRLKELLERMTAPGPFPNMSVSEGHELVEFVYDMAEAAERQQCGVLDQLEEAECDLISITNRSGEPDYEVFWFVINENGTPIGEGSSPIKALKSAFGN